MEPKTFKEQCNELRADCKRIEDACRGLKNTEAVTGPCCLRQMTPEDIEVLETEASKPNARNQGQLPRKDTNE